jgi:hypothetical protein
MNENRIRELAKFAQLKPEEALEFAVLHLDPDELFPLLVSYFPGLRLELPDGLSALDELTALAENAGLYDA